MRSAPWPLAYVLIALSASIEYVFPPLPGDTVALFAVFLAAHKGFNVVSVFATLTAGSIAGGVVAWEAGRYLRRHEARWPAVLKTRRARHALDAVQDGFDRHGPAWLAANRFVPALRAFFFLGAGLAGMRLRAVVLYGGLSAALWNALIMLAGYTVASQWDELRTLVEQYTSIALVIAAIITVAFVVHIVLRGRRAPAVPETDAPAERPDAQHER